MTLTFWNHCVNRHWRSGCSGFSSLIVLAWLDVSARESVDARAPGLAGALAAAAAAALLLIARGAPSKMPLSRKVTAPEKSTCESSLPAHLSSESCLPSSEEDVHVLHPTPTPASSTFFPSYAGRGPRRLFDRARRSPCSLRSPTPPARLSLSLSLRLALLLPSAAPPRGRTRGAARLRRLDTRASAPSACRAAARRYVVQRPADLVGKRPAPMWAMVHRRPLKA